MNSKNTLSEKEKFNIFKVDGYIYSKSVINYILKKQPLYPHRYNGWKLDFQNFLVTFGY